MYSQAELERVLAQLSDDIAALKKKYTELTSELEELKKADYVNVTFKYNNLAGDTFVFTDRTVSVAKNTKVPKPTAHDGSTWTAVISGKRTEWNFSLWRVTADITLTEKRN